MSSFIARPSPATEAGYPANGGVADRSAETRERLGHRAVGMVGDGSAVSREGRGRLAKRKATRYNRSFDTPPINTVEGRRIVLSK